MPNARQVRTGETREEVISGPRWRLLWEIEETQIREYENDPCRYEDS
jgi:hypothetical protein